MNILEITQTKIDLIQSRTDLLLEPNKKIEFGRFLVQKPNEWMDYINFLKDYRPFNRCLEIGAWAGGSFIGISQVSESNAEFIILDINHGPYCDTNSKIKALNIIKKDNQIIHYIHESSQYNETVEKVKKILNKNEFDYIFIDGDHSYDGIKNDFENYFPLLKSNGIFTLHDTKTSHVERIKVKDFWNEIKSNYIHYEFYDESDSWGGIGVVVK